MAKIRTGLIAAAALLLALTGQGAAAAEGDYPTKTIRFIVPFPPGGGTDVLSRLVANKLRETLGWVFVLDNRPGAGGNLGMDLAAKAPADGHTIVMGQTSNLAINPTLYAKLPFDPLKDFAPVTLVASGPLVLVVASGSPYQTLADLVQAARAKPGALTMASPGSGSVAHLAGELFRHAAGIELLHVPYRGASPALTDLIAGQVSMYLSSLPAAIPQIQGGTVRALATTLPVRPSSLPAVPTIAESGYPGFEAASWYGVLVPAATPKPIVERLNAEIVKALQFPDLRERIASEGNEVFGNSAQEFGAFIVAEHAKWARVVKESGAKVE